MIKVSIPTTPKPKCLSFDEIKYSPGIYRPVDYHEKDCRLMVGNDYELILVSNMHVRVATGQHNWGAMKFEKMNETLAFVPNNQ